MDMGMTNGSRAAVEAMLSVGADKARFDLILGLVVTNSNSSMMILNI